MKQFKMLQEGPFQKYDLFDAAEQWMFTARIVNHETFGNGILVERPDSEKKFLVTQSGIFHKLHDLNSVNQESEDFVYIYDLGVRLDYLLR